MVAIAVSLLFGIAMSWIVWEFTGWLIESREENVEVGGDALHRWTMSALR